MVKYPRVLVTTSEQRLVQTGPHEFVLEQPGCDQMGVRHWEFEKILDVVDGDFEQPRWLVLFLCEALARRTRKRKRRRA